MPDEADGTGSAVTVRIPGVSSESFCSSLSVRDFNVFMATNTRGLLGVDVDDFSWMYPSTERLSAIGALTQYVFVQCVDKISSSIL